MDMDGFFQSMDSEPVLSVHSIRKRTKYMRALLKINREVAQQSLVILKNISRILSPYRDAQVMVETFRQFSISKTHRNDPVVEEFLLNNPFYEDPRPDMFEQDTLAGLMKQLAIEINTLTPEIDDTQFSTWLDAGQSRASKHFNQVQSASGSETVHAWRKKTKQAWYLLRYKHGEEISDPDHVIMKYDELGKLLGDVHDLDMLLEFILSYFKKYPSQPMLQYRNEILAHALDRGRDIFS